MEVLADLVRNVIVIILLTTFLDMLLPSSSMQRFVKVIMGLFVLVAVLTPVLNIFTRDQDFAVFNWHQAGIQEGYTTVLQDGNRLTSVNQELFLQNYAVRVEKQMEALVKLVKGANEVKVTVQLQQGKQVGTLEGIKSVQVLVLNKEEPEDKESSLGIKPIKIKISDDAKQKAVEEIERKSASGLANRRMAVSTSEKKTAEEIKKTISQYFGLEVKQINVLF